MAVREWQMQLALKSVRDLVSVIDQLTEEEVLAAIELEKSSRRRKHVLERLTNKAADFNRQSFISKLKE
jgi:hypothetical protein